MAGHEYIYSIILLGILAYAFLLYLHDTTSQPDSVLVAEKHLSTASAFWFFFAAFSFLLVFWLLVRAEHIMEDNGQNSGFLHGLVHLPRVMFSWLANLSLLMAAICYARGSQVEVRKLLARAGKATVAILLWVITWETVGHANNLFWTSLLMAPELAIANIAMLFLGWAFFVRWSGFSSIYLGLAVIYTLLQLPAYLELELDTFFDRRVLETLQIAFPLLAACQVMLAYGFLSLLRRSTMEVEIDQPRYWLGGSRKAANWVSPHVGGNWGGRTVDLAFGAVVAVVMYPVGERLGPLLWQQVFK
jgi:hypothetical protein